MDHQSRHASAPSPDIFDAWDVERRKAYLEAFASDRTSALSEHRVLFEHLRRKSQESEHDKELYDLVLACMSVDDLTHLDLVTIARIHRAPVVQADSFFRSIVTRRRKRQLGLIPEKYLGIGKDRDLLFAETLGIRIPDTFYSGTFNGIPSDLLTNVMLKPMLSSGSKGAFYVFSESNVYSIQHSQTLRSWGEVADAVSAQFGDGALDERVWQVQELIVEGNSQPARDLKFYAFYGEVGLIQEVVRHGTIQYEFFNADRTLAICGRDHEPRFKDKSLTITDKGGLSAEKFDTVVWVSEQIPAPFMRIDFLNGKDELVFTEFSGAPGMSNSLNDEYDEMLGRLYNEAELRLTNDLLSGKEFAGYKEFMRRANPRDANLVTKPEAPPAQPIPSAATVAVDPIWKKVLRPWVRRARSARKQLLAKVRRD